MRLLLILLFLLITTVEAKDSALVKYMSVQKVKAYIRSGPGNNYKVTKKVGKYTPFKALKRTNDGQWIKVEGYNGMLGWINASHLTNMPAVIVKTSEANVRKGPGRNYETIWKAVEGVPFRCLKRNGRWLRVLDVDDEVGWIYDALVWGICY